MSRDVPRTVKVVDTATLLRLEQEAVDRELNQRVPPPWLHDRVADDGQHYVEPALVLGHGEPAGAHLRCQVLIEMANGVAALSLLDVTFASFEQLPESLSPKEKAAAHAALNQPGPLSVAEWAERYDPG